MKAILEFNIPEERDAFKMASNADAMWISISEFDNRLRIWQKHGNHFKDSEEAISEARRLLHDILLEQNISLYQ